jgi:hypothetical protein
MAPWGFFLVSKDVYLSLKTFNEDAPAARLIQVGFVAARSFAVECF